MIAFLYLPLFYRPGELFAGSTPDDSKKKAKKKPATKKAGASTKVFMFDDNDDLFDDPLSKAWSYLF